MNQQPADFRRFLEIFQTVDLPVTLTEETITHFQRANDPLSSEMVRQYIASDEKENEFVEYVPCFRIPETHGFEAIVFWRGDLMKYHFILATYNKNGEGIGSAVIAGTESDGKSVLRSVATIDEDWIIHIVEGDQPNEEKMYRPRSSHAYRMELLATGEIIFLLDENPN